jgi:hypothetical protein
MEMEAPLPSLDQLRENAAECIRLAEAARTSQHKSFFIEMAERWLTLAEHALLPKNSYTTSEAAQSVALAIKTGYPIVQVAVYDSVEYTLSAAGERLLSVDRTK